MWLEVLEHKLLSEYVLVFNQVLLQVHSSVDDKNYICSSSITDQEFISFDQTGWDISLSVIRTV